MWSTAFSLESTDGIILDINYKELILESSGANASLK